MTTSTRFASFAVTVLAIAACGGGGTPTTLPSIATPTGAAISAAPSAASTATGALNPADLGGTWTLVASNPRVVSATGNHVGGTVSIAGDRYTFVAGDYRSEGPIELAGTLNVECNVTRCKFDGVPLAQIQLVAGQPVIVNPATLTPIGSFAGECGWQDIPNAGVLTVAETGNVGGATLPTAFTFVDGAATGVGTNCSTGGHVIAWDVTATRQP